MANILAEAFGTAPAGYVMGSGRASSPAVSYAGMRGLSPDEAMEMATSSLGTPIHFRFGIQKGNYGVFADGRYEQVPVADFQFPLSTMVTISRTKRDRITPVSSGDDHVVELYSFNPWEVRIQGVCIDDPGHPQATRAEEQRRRIIELESLADSVKLQEQEGLFTDLGIYELYIRSVRFGQLVGRPHLMPFEMTCLSMKPLELRAT